MQTRKPKWEQGFERLQQPETVLRGARWGGKRYIHTIAFFADTSCHLQVLRQGSFIKKIHDLGWTSPSYFEKRQDAAALHYAILRYHV
jgi:hypothetical protein